MQVYCFPIGAYHAHADPSLLAKWTIGLDTYVPGSFGQLTEIEVGFPRGSPLCHGYTVDGRNMKNYDEILHHV